MSSAAIINQKKYLKKYLGIGHEPGEKRKKKKTDKIVGNRLKIIDDDIDVDISQEIQDDIALNNEDAPQIVAVIDERPPSLRIDEETKSKLWKPIGEPEDLNTKVHLKMGSFQLKKPSKDIIGLKLEIANKLKAHKTRKESDFHKSKSKDFTKVKEEGTSHEGPSNCRFKDNLSQRYEDHSSSRKDINSDGGMSPLRSRIKIESDQLPLRKSDDISPPRRKCEDMSPPRRKGEGISPPRRKGDDMSPPRRRGEDISPPVKRRGEDMSPPRRKGEDILPPRRKGEDISPPRRKYDDISPPRRRHHDISPPRRKHVDLSPPHRRKDSMLPPRRRGDDLSPPRRRGDDFSPPRRKGRDISPPRRIKYEQGDLDLCRKIKVEKNETPSSRRIEDNSGGCDDLTSYKRQIKREDSHSPSRRTKASTSGDMSPHWKKNVQDDNSPPRKRNDQPSSSRSARQGRSRWADRSPELKNEKSETPERAQKTLSGKRAGLQSAKELVKEITSLRVREEEVFQNMSDEVSGRNAATVSRAQKPKDLEEEAQKLKKQKEIQEKYDRWGKGLKQVQDEREKMSEQLHEMSKPLARYADDEDLEKYLKEQEREGDPMLAYIRKKKKKKAVEAGIPDKPMFMGEFMPNRFGIGPGHRWDGVDRSNGYESKWFKVFNARKAQQEEAFKWSTEDM